MSDVDPAAPSGGAGSPAAAERWLVVTVTAPDPDAAALLADALLSLGGTGVLETADRLTTYVRAPADLDAWLGTACRAMDAAVPGASRGLEWRWEADQDWHVKWREGLRPRRVGQRFIVAPSWTTPDAGAGDIVLTIDPEMAFGTGEHATTRAALRMLEAVVRKEDRVLDVGTGSGILAIGAARLGASRVLAVEADGDAIETAVANVRRHGLEERIEVVHAVVDEAFLRRSPAEFDVIVANVLSGVLKPLLRPFRGALAPGGRLILGGILVDEASAMQSAATGAGYRITAEDVEGEWWTVLLEPESR